MVTGSKVKATGDPFVKTLFVLTTLYHRNVKPSLDTSRKAKDDPYSFQDHRVKGQGHMWTSPQSCKYLINRLTGVLWTVGSFSCWRQKQTFSPDNSFFWRINWTAVNFSWNQLRLKPLMRFMSLFERSPVASSLCRRLKQLVANRLCGFDSPDFVLPMNTDAAAPLHIQQLTFCYPWHILHHSTDTLLCRSFHFLVFYFPAASLSIFSSRSLQGFQAFSLDFSCMFRLFSVHLLCLIVF